MNFNWKKIFKNKYLIAIVIFIIIVLFLDDNNLIERLNLSNEKSDLNTQIEFYENEIHESNRKLEELKTSPENLEKFAREEYFMKKEKEEVYIIVEDQE